MQKDAGYDDRLEFAFALWRERQERTAHPEGKFDSAGRWYPSDAEEEPCCKGIRSPSRAYPYSLMLHCRTARHVARMFGVKASDLHKRHRAKTPPRREGGEQYFKLAAIVDGRFFSVYDGETEYVLGETMRETARQKHGGGFYVYTSPDDAQRAMFPEGSAHKPPARFVDSDFVGPPDYVILRLRAEGSYCRYPGKWGDPDKLAFSTVTPLEVVRELAVDEA